MDRRALIASLSGLAACNPKSEPPKQAAAPAKPRATPPSPYSKEFWTHWGDGQAEMNGYDLTITRYGKARKGTAVAIYVTETFANSIRVKSDPGRRSAADEFPAMKLNLIKDYQTGIYDYNDMLSVFVALVAVNGRRAGDVTKISYSCQEWCGHVYSQALFGGESAYAIQHSYFDGEADEQRTVSVPNWALSEDALLLWARKINRPRVTSARTVEVPLLQSLEAQRMQHEPIQLRRTYLDVSRTPLSIQVPAGTFETELFTARTDRGITRRIWVERAFPHRVIKWDTTSGEKAELLGSDRLKYWELNGPGGEEALARIGLTPRPPRTT
jgi:hypothetical protein